MKMSGLRLAILFFALSAANLFGEQTNKMVWRAYNVGFFRF